MAKVSKETLEKHDEIIKEHLSVLIYNATYELECAIAEIERLIIELGPMHKPIMSQTVCNEIVSTLRMQQAKFPADMRWRDTCGE